MRLLALSADDVRAAVDMSAAIDAVADAYTELSAGRAQSPVRLGLEADGGVALFMPAFLSRSGAMGAKIVSVFQGNAERGLPSINGIVLLLDPETGVPRAIMDGTYLTALRTGAGSGAATRALAREDARVLTVFGAGAQARTQIAAVRAVRDIREVRVVSRTRTSAQRLADELEGVEASAVDDPTEAVRGADVICAATTSTTPVFPGTAVEPGTHVNGVGSFKPTMQEVDAQLLSGALVVVDARDAALEEAGDLIIPIREGVFGADHVAAELGEILAGRAPGRTSPDQVTYFKSVGNAVQDVAVGLLAVREAEARGLGATIEL
jgi:alanine dehydrogenase